MEGGPSELLYLPAVGLKVICLKKSIFGYENGEHNKADWLKGDVLFLLLILYCLAPI